jgi:hypothetical protein
LNPNGNPYFEAVATTGEGVLDTLTKITKMVLQHIEMGTSGKQQRVTPPLPDRPQVSPSLQHAEYSQSGMAQPGSSSLGVSRPGLSPKVIHQEESPQLGAFQPSPSLSLEETTPAIHKMEPELDLSRYEEPEPRGMEPKPKSILGRIQIVGTDNAEIISANAISVPIRVKIEGDVKEYRMDLAIKLDGFKQEE